MKINKHSYRVKLNKDRTTYTYGLYNIEYKSNLTGNWIIATSLTFLTKGEAMIHLIDNVKVK